jgi:hypothetical protein
MTIKPTSVTALVTVVLALGACKTTPSLSACEYPQNAVNRESPLPENSAGLLGDGLDNQLRITGRRAGRVALQTASASRTRSGTLEARVTLRNCSDERIDLEARAHFMSELGEPVEPPGPWQRVFLDAYSIASFSEFSISTERVARYYVEVREANQP